MTNIKKSFIGLWKNKFFKIFIVIIIPLTVSLFIFSDRNIPIRQQIVGTEVIFYPDFQKINAPSIENNIHKLFSIPFNLGRYQICIYRGDSRIIYSNNKSDSIDDVNIITKNESISLRIHSRKCPSIDSDANFSFRLSYNITLNITKQLGDTYVKNNMGIVGINTQQNMQLISIETVDLPDGRNVIGFMRIRLEHPPNNSIDLINFFIPNSVYNDTEDIRFEPQITMKAEYPLWDKFALITTSTVILSALLLTLFGIYNFIFKKD